MHRYGFYLRRKHPTGPETTVVRRFFDPSTGRTASILPSDHIPYRPVQAARLQQSFDYASGTGSALDPPAGEIEAGCLRRAWQRLTLRINPLQRAFDQLISPSCKSVKTLWQEIYRVFATLGETLLFLFEKHNLSLLGDYPCSSDWRR